MTNDELRALNKTRHIQQIAWLTRDLEKSMQAWIDTLRIGPWRVFRFTEKTVKNLKVDGKLVESPFEFRIAITHVGDMEIELIEPVSGPMIYEDYIRRRGEGACTTSRKRSPTIEWLRSCRITRRETSG
jgi:methylmalonyl-CoA/ethylmalonyl-CoA epimerase